MTSLLHVSLGAGLALASVALIDAAQPERWTETGMALSAEGAIAVQTEDYDYSIPKDVAWTDVRGGYHMDGRPECLPPVGRLVGPVSFTAEPVEAAGYERRQVVHVTCLAPSG